MHRLVILLLTTATTALAAQEAASSGDVPFRWRERVAPGAWLKVYVYSGTVDVTETTSAPASVEGQPSSSSMDARYEVVRDGENVVLCVLPDDGYTCGREGITHSRRRHRDTRGGVDVTVKAPKGVRVVAHSGNGVVTVTGVTSEIRASSGNGAVSVDGAASPVMAHSGNGDVRVTTDKGPVSATTGNGRVEVRMLALSGMDDMEFRSGNGKVFVELPGSFAGYLDASTGNGRVDTDFPVTVQGRFNTSHISGAIGNAGGGPRIRLSSGNGDLVLRKVASGGGR